MRVPRPAAGRIANTCIRGEDNRVEGEGRRDEGTGNRDQGTGNRDEGTGNRDQGTEIREKEAWRRGAGRMGFLCSGPEAERVVGDQASEEWR
jgi:hypothetical protein